MDQLHPASPDRAASGEIRALTGVRGIAACQVAAYHFLANPDGHGLYQAVLRHGYIAVDLFFVLSGFVMALTYARGFEQGFRPGAYGLFLMKRLGRVYPLYLVTTLAALVVVAEPAGPVTLGSNLLMAQAWGLAGSINGPAWSISTEFAAYLLFPLLLTLAVHGGPVRAVVAAVLSVAVLAAVGYVSDQTAAEGLRNGPLDLYQGTTPWPLLRCLAGFTLGLAVFRLWRERRLQALFARPLAGDLAALAVLLLLPLRLDTLLVLAFTALVPALASGRGLAARFCAWGPVHWLGHVSYSVYLTHRLVLDVARGPLFDGLNRLGVPHAFSISGALTVLLTIAVAALTYRLIEKPGRDAVRRLLHRPAPPLAAEPGAP